MNDTSQFAMGNLLGGGLTQGGQSGINLETGQPINNPSLQQMNTGTFSMGAGGPVWSNPAPAPNTAGNSSSDNFFAQANAPMQPRVASVGANPANGNPAYIRSILQQLMGSFNQQSGAQDSQYQQLLQSLLGKNGITAQMQNATKDYGAGQQQMLDLNQKNQTGGLQQNLTSRGLGNSTIQNSLMGGLNRNQNIEQQNLASNIATQKMQSLPQQANIQMGAFNANPFNQQQGQYANLIQRLGSVG